MVEADMEVIADFLVKSIAISKRIQESHGKKLVDFNKGAEEDSEIKETRKKVNEWAKQFGMPGV